jgi:hypothetical protein
MWLFNHYFLFRHLDARVYKSFSRPCGAYVSLSITTIQRREGSDRCLVGAERGRDIDTRQKVRREMQTSDLLLKHPDTTLLTYVRRYMKHLKYAYKTTPDLLLKHLDETLVTYVQKQLKHLKYTLETLAKTYATSRWNTCKHTSGKTYETSEHTLEIYMYIHCNIPIYFCNIQMKYLKHLKYTFATWAFNAMSSCCLDKWRLVVVELDGGRCRSSCANDTIADGTTSHKTHALVCLLEHPSWRLASSVETAAASRQLGEVRLRRHGRSEHGREVEAGVRDEAVRWGRAARWRDEREQRPLASGKTRPSVWTPGWNHYPLNFSFRDCKSWALFDFDNTNISDFGKNRRITYSLPYGQTRNILPKNHYNRFSLLCPVIWNYS